MKNKSISMVKKTTLFLSVVFLLVACGDKKPKQLNYIPKDVSGVVAVDMKKLAIKSLELKDILNADIFKKGLPTAADTIVGKIKNSGIDLLNTVYVFGDVEKGEEKNYAAAVFALEDETKFEALLKNDAKATEVKTDNDIKYTYVSDAIVGWKDKIGIIVFIDRETDKEKSKTKLKNLFTQPEDNSLASANDKFKNLLKEEGDVSIFVNYERIGDLISKASAMPIATTNFKDTYLTSTINFENGKIVSDTKIYNNEANHKMAKELYKASVSKDLVKAQPGGDVVAFMSFGINMEPTIKYLQEAKLLDGINQGLKSLGPEFDANYVAAALSGDFIATLNSLSVKEVSKMDYMTGEMKPGKDIAYEYAVTIGLKDAAKFQKLLDAVAAQGGIVKGDKYYKVANMAFLVPRSNSIVIVSGETVATDLAANKNTAMNAADVDLISANTMTFGVDISKVKPEVYEFMGADAVRIAAALPFESLYLSAEEVKGDAVTTKGVLNFKNKDQNSLISLQQSIKDADKFMPKTPEPTAYDDVVVDSTAAIPSEVPVEEVQ
jgi:hypothetical protein